MYRVIVLLCYTIHIYNKLFIFLINIKLTRCFLNRNKNYHCYLREINVILDLNNLQGEFNFDIIKILNITK